MALRPALWHVGRLSGRLKADYANDNFAIWCSRSLGPISFWAGVPWQGATNVSLS